MNKFNLPQGLLDSVTSVLKTSPRDTAPLQEKLIRGNQEAVKSTTDFDKAVAAVVAEGRKAEAEKQAKFAEAASSIHKGMGKSIVEAIATKEEAVKEEFIIAESAFDEIATRMKNIGNARRMQNMTEQKETIAQMTRTFGASFDQIVEANTVEMSQDAILALAEAKAEIRTQMLNAVNVAAAARVVDESAKIMAFIAVHEALKGKQHKIDANKNGKIDANDFEVLKTRKARHQGEAVDEQAQPVEEGWDDMLKDVKSKMGTQPNGGSGVKKGKRYGGAAQKNDSGEEKEEKKEVKEGVMAKVKSFAKKALEKVGHGSDEDLLNDLRKKSGVDVEKFKKNTAMDVGSLKKRLAKEEVEQVAEVSTKLIGRAVNAAGKKAFAAGEAGDNAGEANKLAQQDRLTARGAAKKQKATCEEVELSAEEAERIAKIAKDLGL